MHAAVRAWATERKLHIESPTESSLDPRTDPYAVFDHPTRTERSYRYALARTWDPDRPAITVVMLNPSTAGASHHRDDDPTMRRCRTLAHAAGYGSLLVINLFALIATDPAKLYQHPDPIGPASDDLLDLVGAMEGPLLLAWGTKHSALRGRSAAVLSRLESTTRPMLTFGLNVDGSPKHPLYLKAPTTPRPFAPQPAAGGRAQQVRRDAQGTP
jgi:hypothetical protein